MEWKILKKYTLAFFIILILLIIPASFAGDNSSDIVFSGDNQIIMPDSIYFDSSVENDGNGTQSNPFKYFSSEKIGDNAIVYLADGEYLLDESFNAGNLTIIGQSRNNTIIHGNGISLSAFENLDISYLTLNNLRIVNTKNFKASNVIFENNHVNEYGGAVTVQSNAIHTLIDNSVFIYNSAVRGGAIYVDSNSGTFYVENSTFENNSASESGGAILIEHQIDSQINNSRFINNNVSQGAGGAIFTNNSRLNIKGTSFTASKASYGAAIYDHGSDLTLIETAATNNLAENDGGAIYKEEGSLTLYQASFDNNTALNGAAIYTSKAESLTVIASNFTSNLAKSGQVIYSSANRKEYFIANMINDINLVSYIKTPDLTILMKDSSPLILSCVFTGNSADSDSFTFNLLMPFSFNIVREVSSLFKFDDIINVGMDELFDVMLGIVKNALFPSQKLKIDDGLPPTDRSFIDEAFSYLTTLSMKADPGGVEAVINTGNYNLFNISGYNNSNIMLSLNAFGVVINNDLGIDDFSMSIISDNYSFVYSLGYMDAPISLDVGNAVNVDSDLFNISLDDNSLRLSNGFINVSFDDLTYSVDVLVNGEASSFVYLGNNLELFSSPLLMDVSDGINMDFNLFNISMNDNSLRLSNGFINVNFDDLTYSVDVLVNGESSSFVYLGKNFELLNAPLSLDVKNGINMEFPFFSTSYSLNDNSFNLMSGLCNLTFDNSAYSVGVLANDEYSSFDYIDNNFELISAASESSFALFNTYYDFENNSLVLFNGLCSLKFDNADYSINLISNDVVISTSLIPKFGNFLTISPQE